MITNSGKRILEDEPGGRPSAEAIEELKELALFRERAFEKYHKVDIARNLRNDCYEIAMLYYEGEREPEDYAESLKWLKKAEKCAVFIIENKTENEDDTDDELHLIYIVFCMGFAYLLRPKPSPVNARKCFKREQDLVLQLYDEHDCYIVNRYARTFYNLAYVCYTEKKFKRMSELLKKYVELSEKAYEDFGYSAGNSYKHSLEISLRLLRGCDQTFAGPLILEFCGKLDRYKKNGSHHEDDE